MADTSTSFDAAQLIVTHQRGVWRYLRSLGCDASLAEDLTQETFLKVLQRPFEERSQAATAAYLRTTARNLYISVLRQAGRNLDVDIAELEASWSRWAELDGGDTLIETLKSCLETITDRARQALEMRFRDQASRADIAGSLGISEHGAKNLMQRAKQALKTCIEQKTNE